MAPLGIMACGVLASESTLSWLGNSVGWVASFNLFYQGIILAQGTDRQLK
jgi:hypothetical protein